MNSNVIASNKKRKLEIENPKKFLIDVDFSSSSEEETISIQKQSSSSSSSSSSSTTKSQSRPSTIQSTLSQSNQISLENDVKSSQNNVSLTNAIAKFKNGDYSSNNEILFVFQELKLKQIQKNGIHSFDYSLILFYISSIFEKLNKIEDSWNSLKECKEIQSKLILSITSTNSNTTNLMNSAYLETLLFGALFMSRRKQFMQSFLWFEERRQLMIKQNNDSTSSNNLLIQISMENSRSAKLKWIRERYFSKEKQYSQKDFQMKRDLLLSAFTGDFFPFDSKASVVELIEMALAHRESKTALPNSIKFELEFAKILNNIAANHCSQNDDENSSVARYALFYLSLCIQHRLLAPDVLFDFETQADWTMNWHQLSPISWKILTSIQRFSRLLLLKQRLTVRKQSVLVCIFRTIANDKTQNQKYFSRLQSWVSNRKTLGKKKREFWINHFLAIDEKSFLFYVRSLENLLNSIDSKKTKWISRIAMHIKFLKSFL